MISARLYAIAKQIEKGEVVCDIGTDHALLPVFLIKSNLAKKVYAVDLKKAPLNQAKRNIKKYSIPSNDIELILSDGLKWINSKTKTINSCIISGLGGSTILNILNDDCSKIEKYILCPNNNEIVIRKWVKLNKYYIEKEMLVSDNNIIYLIIVINKFIGLKVKNFKDELFGPYMRRHPTKEYFNYWILKYAKINSYYFKLNKFDKKFKNLNKEKKLIKKELNRETIIDE